LREPRLIAFTGCESQRPFLMAVRSHTFFFAYNAHNRVGAWELEFRVLFNKGADRFESALS